MEAGEDKSSLKRQRAPLSDSEDNVSTSSEANDGQKRRRLDATGQENLNPQPMSSRRLAEREAKPDTPIVPSVRSRVQQLTQRREGGAPVAQRCVSDPGADVDNRHLLGEGEFNQRVERFKTPVFMPNPNLSPNLGGSCPRTRSDFVSGIQQKLQGTATPSSKQASRIRQEREQELNQLHFQPISQNAWLKRSASDQSLNQQVTTPPVFSTPSPWISTSRRRAQWPPVQPWDQVDGDADVKGDSFTDTVKPLGDTTGPGTSSELRDQEEIRKTQTVLQLSFSEGESSSQNVPERPVDQTYSVTADESNMQQTEEVPKDPEETEHELVSFEEGEDGDGSSCGEEALEPSTDEELKMWRYPRYTEEVGAARQGDEEELESSRVVKGGGVEKNTEHHVVCACSETEQHVKSALHQVHLQSESCLNECLQQKQTVKDQGDSKECKEAVNEEQKDTEAVKDETDSGDSVKQAEGCPTQSVDIEVEVEDVRQAETEDSDVKDEEQETGVDERTEGHPIAQGGRSTKKVTLILEPELISESTSPVVDASMSDAELNSHDETNTADIIDQMFEEVLEYAERIEEEQRDDDDGEDQDSGIGVCSGEKEKMDTESEKKKSGEEAEAKDEEHDENNGDELMFPPSGILSPLSKSVEAVVTPLRLAATQESNPSSLLLTPEDTTTPIESAPLYSVDAYRTQRQSKPPPIQSVTPGPQRQAVDLSRPQPSVNTKEKIAALSEEAGKLQTVINQTLQALSCCTDEDHGRGSLEEAEAEKLLLVSCEKRSALLAEVTRLREERSSESGEDDRDLASQKPCRGTVSITNIQLPLKVEFVCSSHNRPGRPSHYFFILIRYGPCNIVATPLATAADAQNGDTISFPTSVTLKDIRSTFEIDVEVYSLSHTTGTNCSMDRISTKSRVTPRKLLNTLTRSSNSLTSAALPALNIRRSSNFCLVGSHKITLASLGHSKFPLDKMKLEGKIRRLLGDEFQEKVPFLSPLEGNVYLRLDSEGHSNVQHQGFLTMFELISGFGVWHRRYFVLEGCNMFYWNHPNDRETKDAEGSISLSSSPSQCVRPVKRDSCARPFTFELVSSVQKQQQDNSQDTPAKCWFSADTKQERLDWMEKVNQALLDFHTWNNTSTTKPQSSSDSGIIRESIL